MTSTTSSPCKCANYALGLDNEDEPSSLVGREYALQRKVGDPGQAVRVCDLHDAHVGGEDGGGEGTRRDPRAAVQDDVGQAAAAQGRTSPDGGDRRRRRRRAR